jgi:hypothetical protein
LEALGLHFFVTTVAHFEKSGRSLVIRRDAYVVFLVRPKRPKAEILYAHIEE